MVISSGSELRSSGCSWCRSTILLWRYTQNSSLYTGNSDAMGCSVTVSLPHSLCTEAARAQYNLGWLRGDLIEITQFPYNIDLREASVRICYFSPPRANINIARFSHTNQTYMPKLKGTTMSEKKHTENRRRRHRTELVGNENETWAKSNKLVSTRT